MKYLTILFLYAFSLGAFASGSMDYEAGQSAINEVSYLQVDAGGQDRISTTENGFFSEAFFAMSDGLNSRQPGAVVAKFWLIGSVLAGLGLLVVGRFKA